MSSFSHNFLQKRSLLPFTNLTRSFSPMGFFSEMFNRKTPLQVRVRLAWGQRKAAPDQPAPQLSSSASLYSTHITPPARAAQNDALTFEPSTTSSQHLAHDFTPSPVDLIRDSTETSSATESTTTRTAIDDPQEGKEDLFPLTLPYPSLYIYSTRAEAINDAKLRKASRNGFVPPPLPIPPTSGSL
jgi:hypothetical protein